MIRQYTGNCCVLGISKYDKIDTCQGNTWHKNVHMINITAANKQVIYLLAVVITFIVWGILYTANGVYVAHDGMTYLYIFDDAMISMRYAWNLAHGHGLVWNPGEPPVQGFTNMLMTLFMVLPNLLFSKHGAATAVQVSGFVFHIMAAYLAFLIARLFISGDGPTSVKLLPAISFICVLFYYPLAFWSLTGMETGLLTVCFLAGLYFTLLYEQNHNVKYLYLSACFLALAFLSRYESSLCSAITGCYALLTIIQNRNNGHIKHWIACVFIYFSCVFGLLLFQHSYYGEWLPNTYTLKVEGFPLGLRLYQGFMFILVYLQGTIFMFVFIFADLISGANKKKALFMLCCLAIVLYQVYVGGDAWALWRITCPIMPLLFILFVSAITSDVDTAAGQKQVLPAAAVGSRLADTLRREVSTRDLILLLLLVGPVLANALFMDNILLSKKPYFHHFQKRYVDTALAMNELTRDNADVGVVAAGTISYYTDSRASIDFLGKSDRHIARLKPDISGLYGYETTGAISRPGHNKFDLEYSIKKLKPTSMESFARGGKHLDEYIFGNYAIIDYHGTSVWLKADSPDVLWDKVKKYKALPYLNLYHFFAATQAQYPQVNYRIISTHTL